MRQPPPEGYLNAEMVNHALQYPSLFQCRQQILNHMFACYGTEMEWVREHGNSGQYLLLNDEPHTYKVHEFRDKSDRKHSQPYMKPEWYKKLKKSHDVNDIPSYDWWWHWYPMSHYSPTFEVIAMGRRHIHPDFVKAALETLLYILMVPAYTLDEHAAKHQEEMADIRYPGLLKKDNPFAASLCMPNKDEKGRADQNKGFANALVELYCRRFGLNIWTLYKEGLPVRQRVDMAWEVRKA